MEVKVANNFKLRLIGLLDKKMIGKEEALLIKNSRRVHSYGMRFSIAVFYLDYQGEVLDKEILIPNRIGKKVKKTKHVLEMHPSLFLEENTKIKEYIYEEFVS